MPKNRLKNLLAGFSINFIIIFFVTIIQKADYIYVFYTEILFLLSFVGLIFVIENNRMEGLIKDPLTNDYKTFRNDLIICGIVFLCVSYLPLNFLPTVLFAYALSRNVNGYIPFYLSSVYVMLCGLCLSWPVEIIIIYGILNAIILSILQIKYEKKIFLLISLFCLCFICGYLCIYFCGVYQDSFYLITITVAAVVLAIAGYILNQKFKYGKTAIKSNEAEACDYLSFIDESFPLVKDIKNFSQAEYNHARNLSRAAGLCAKAINGNVDLAKSAGFYYRLGILSGEPIVENSIKLAYDYCFPEKILQILKEYDAAEQLPSSKESAIIHMTNMCLKKAELLRTKKLSSNWNQDMVIYQTLNELSATGIYDESGLSMNQFLIIRDTLVNEGLII